MNGRRPNGVPKLAKTGLAECRSRLFSCAPTAAPIAAPIAAPTPSLIGRAGPVGSGRLTLFITPKKNSLDFAKRLAADDEVDAAAGRIRIPAWAAVGPKNRIPASVPQGVERSMGYLFRKTLVRQKRLRVRTARPATPAHLLRSKSVTKQSTVLAERHMNRGE